MSTFTNYCEIVENDAYLRGRIRFNALYGRPFLRGFFWDIEEHPIRDNDLYNIRKFIAAVYGISNKENIRQAVEIVANSHAYHPVREELEAIEWDGTPRLADFLPRYLGAPRSDYTTAVTRLMFFAAIRRVFDPGCKFDYCIILADTKQGTGKSSICRFMALKDEWFTDSLGDLSKSAKAFESLCGHWIIEMAEMVSTNRTKDVESIKAFLTRTADDYRRPYGVYAERQPRQCIFIGTSNRPQFLPNDKTGNRRFIPIMCDGNRAEVHPMANEAETREYIRQCYGEAMALGEAEGYSLTLGREFIEELQELQEEGTPEDSMIGMVQNYLDKLDPSINLVCSRMIWDGITDPDSHREPQKYELQEIADAMNLQIVGWERYAGKSGKSKGAKHRFDQYGAQRAWQRIENFVPSSVPSESGLGTKLESLGTENGFIPVKNTDIDPFWNI